MIGLINKKDCPIDDTTKFHVFVLGGQHSPSVKTHDGDTSAHTGDELRPFGIPRYYVDAVAGEPSGDLKRYTDSQFNALAVVKDAKDEMQMNQDLAHQKNIEALKAMKADSSYTKVSNAKIDKYLAKMKSRRDS